jgi:hypothetical protein
MNAKLTLLLLCPIKVYLQAGGVTYVDDAAAFRNLRAEEVVTRNYAGVSLAQNVKALVRGRLTWFRIHHGCEEEAHYLVPVVLT